MTGPLSRRRFLATTAAASVAIGTSTWQSAAKAATGPNPLTPDDPRVPALGYVADAAKAKGDPMFKPGSSCSNCSQLKGNVGDKLRPCALFPDLKDPKQMLLVSSSGWCRSWTAMPKSS